MTGEVEQLRQLFRTSVRMTRIGEPTLRVTELVEKRVTHCINRRETLSWRVFQEGRNQLDSITGCLAEDLYTRQIYL